MLSGAMPAMNDVRGFAHDWENISTTGATGRKAPHRCRVCGMRRRWSEIDRKMAYYHAGKGFIGNRPGRCTSKGYR